ncbi:MAG: hypothetical protein N2653_14845 [Burkholderiales bacterium]|nr:hypothetical protein [Burkholderiales bacterium]
MRTTVDLPEDLFRALKARAALKGTTLKALVTHLLQRGLAASEATELRRTPSRLPAPVRGAGKMKSYSNAELAALADSLTDARAAKR